MIQKRLYFMPDPNEFSFEELQYCALYNEYFVFPVVVYVPYIYHDRSRVGY